MHVHHVNFHLQRASFLWEAIYIDDTVDGSEIRPATTWDV